LVPGCDVIFVLRISPSCCDRSLFTESSGDGRGRLLLNTNTDHCPPSGSQRRLRGRINGWTKRARNCTTLQTDCEAIGQLAVWILIQYYTMQCGFVIRYRNSDYCYENVYNRQIYFEVLNGINIRAFKWAFTTLIYEFW